MLPLDSELAPIEVDWHEVAPMGWASITVLRPVSMERIGLRWPEYVLTHIAGCPDAHAQGVRLALVPPHDPAPDASLLIDAGSQLLRSLEFPFPLHPQMPAVCDIIIDAPHLISSYRITLHCLLKELSDQRPA
jgi:hypothetical protein